MVRDFQRIIGLEARRQVLDLTGRLPDAVVACVGGGSNAIGTFHAFLDDAGRPAGRHARPAATASRPAGTPPRSAAGTVGVLHGARSLPAAGRRRADRRVALDLRRAGLSRASGPSTPTWPRSAGRSTAPSPTPQAMDAFALLSRTEGIIPAIESAHAVAGAADLAREIGPGRDGAGQRVRPRRQGHGDRDALVRARDGPRRDRACRRWSRALAGLPGPTGPGRAGRVPARRLPDRRRPASTRSPR